MSIHDKRRVYSIVGLKFMGKVGEEVDRRKWLDEHPDELHHPEDDLFQRRDDLLAAIMNEKDAQKGRAILAELTEVQNEIAEDGAEEPLFDQSRIRGASGMYGFAFSTFAQFLHDYAPSEGGIGRRQAIGLGQAQKTGVAIEPKKQGFFGRLLGRGKDEQKAGTGAG